MRASLLPLLALMTGCLNPDDRLPLTGNVKSREPAEGQVVRLLRTRGQPPQHECDPATAQAFRTTTVDADGGFRFDLFRVEAQALAGIGQFCFRVETEFASGSRATTDLRYMDQPTRVATLHDWRSQLELDGGILRFAPAVPWPSETVELNDAGFPITWGVQLNHRADVRGLDGGLLWRAHGRFHADDGGFGFQREEIAIPDLALEDFEGRLELFARLDEGETRVDRIYEVRLPAVMLVADRSLALRGQRTPFSRGLPCPDFGTPCPLTDGKLEPVDGGFLPVVALELGATRPVQAIVLRGVTLAGASIELRLEQEDGGAAHEQVLRVGHPAFDEATALRHARLRDGGYVQLREVDAVLTVDGAVDARRVVLTFGGGVVEVEELSVF